MTQAPGSPLNKEADAADLVAEFALSLDAEDYERTRACLASHCEYESPDGKLTGPAAILNSYRGNGDKARRLFDSIEYRHEIVELNNSWFQIRFIDILRAGNRSHEFRCHQRVRVEAGKIVEIIHEEIPGLRDQLNAFLDSLG